MSAEVPLRPMTLGEVLDAGVALLRRRPAIVAVAMALAGVEQALVAWLPGALDTRAALASSFWHHPAATWAFLAVGMGSEAAIFGIVGAWSARSLLGLVTGAAAGGTTLALRPRWAPVILVSLLTGTGAALAFVAGAVPWIFWFMLTALITPTLVVEGGAGASTGASVRRAIRLAARGLAAGRARLLVYLPWLVVRLLMLVTGADAVAELLSITSQTAITVIGYVLWIGLNGMLYATIAGVDAAAYLETRIRTEGLDIAIGHAVRTGAPIEPALAVPR